MPARNAKINVAAGRNVLPGALKGIGIRMYNATDSGVENSISKTPIKKGTMCRLLLKMARMLRGKGRNWISV